MSHTFVSIVGTQIMGTLHPRQAFLRACPGGRSILLATKATEEHALRLKSWAARHDGCDVDILSIPMTAGTKESASAVVARLAEEAEASGGRIFFNVDGGMNYLIADCVVALGNHRPVFIQSSEMRSLAFDTETGLVERLADADRFSVREMLELQGVEWSRAASSSPLVDWCAQQGMALPEGCETGLAIDGVTFDVVWNPGSNRINFMKDMRFLPKDSKERVNIERKLVQWAADRKRSTQLYDRRVYAVVSDEKTAHRLQTESCGKIEVLDRTGEFGEHSPLRGKLEKVFARRAVFKDASETLKPQKQKAESPLEDGTLIVSVGTNIVPTITALRSHKARHAVLCCTKDLEDVAKRIKNAADFFGFESVRIVRVTVEGNYLETLLPAPAEGAHVSINITPGTKGQGAMLAWWGRSHGCSVWSIDNRNGLCVPLFAPHDEQPLKVVPCDMETRFLVEGALLRSCGELSEADREMCRVMLAFMRVSIDEDRDDDVMKRAVSAGGMRLEPGKGKEWVLTAGGTAYRFSTEGGEWLEKLAAAALEEAGFTDVRYRVRFSWPEAIEKTIRRENSLSSETDVFSLDLDVTGSRNNDIVVISCKANPYASVEDAADEVAATGERLGRFALRMLLHVNEKLFSMHGDNVMVFGWRLLCRREELLKLIETLRLLLRTTEE
ncbi:hypothetical protein [Mailhella massiliensis]|uniref:DUF1887 family protein n=1 Tax=Mailhella massiliensis TaxID=1903261 RepID=A0A921AXT7_9BACT|nr:hypothetical protein [Mailhella massiliensis]HJD98108.1 hypothetical protein [Mailhella massiliensis]